MVINQPTGKIATTLKEVEKLISPDGVKRKLDRVVESVPPDKRCDVKFKEKK